MYTILDKQYGVYIWYFTSLTLAKKAFKNVFSSTLI